MRDEGPVIEAAAERDGGGWGCPTNGVGPERARSNPRAIAKPRSSSGCGDPRGLIEPELGCGQGGRVMAKPYSAPNATLLDLRLHEGDRRRPEESGLRDDAQVIGSSG